MKKTIAFVIPFLFPLVAFAASNDLQNPLAFKTLYEFLVAILDLVALIAFPVLVLFFVYIGFLFVKANADADNLKKARSYLFWALVGALMVLGGKVLALAIEATVKQLGA